MRWSRVIIVPVLIAASVVSIGWCRSGPDPPGTVSVDFEIQLINASSPAWGFGIDGGEGEQGFGATNETITGTVVAAIGVPVFCKVFGEHWDSSDPGHEVICRILVDSEEIYVCGDLGSADEETLAECGGPVYLPDDEQ